MSDGARAKTIYCSDPWFTLIQEGKKPVEGRKNSTTWCRMGAGDTFLFVEPESVHTVAPRMFQAKITGVTVYPRPKALRRYLEGETLARALPGVETFEEGEKIYLQYLGTQEEIEEHGMRAFQVEVIR